MEQFVITLIAAPGQPLPDEIPQQLTAALNQSGVTVNEVRIIAPHRAVDMIYTGSNQASVRLVVAEFLGAQPIDAIIQPLQHRRKKLLISDMDSTMIEQECIDELADFIGKKDIISAITERAMNGELDFKAALRERVALLAGLPEEALHQTFTNRITLMPGAKQLVGVMKHNGAQCILVSGGFTFFTGKVAKALGFDADEANILEIAHGKLTGKVIEPILDKEAKLLSLKHHAAQHGLALDDTMAVGDGANDLPMILAAGLGVAYHAKPTVRAQAAAALNHNDLSALLYVQGYGQQEIDAYV
jgi:phosphoserine phosphatase